MLRNINFLMALFWRCLKSNKMLIYCRMNLLCCCFPRLCKSTGCMLALLMLSILLVYLDLFSNLILFITLCCQIEIKELDDLAQVAFHGYKSLNRIQSRIFQTVYNTNENILVSYLFSMYISSYLVERIYSKVIS